MSYLETFDYCCCWIARLSSVFLVSLLAFANVIYSDLSFLYFSLVRGSSRDLCFSRVRHSFRVPFYLYDDDVSCACAVFCLSFSFSIFKMNGIRYEIHFCLECNCSYLPSIGHQSIYLCPILIWCDYDCCFHRHS